MLSLLGDPRAAMAGHMFLPSHLQLNYCPPIRPTCHLDNVELGCLFFVATEL